MVPAVVAAELSLCQNVSTVIDSALMGQCADRSIHPIKVGQTSRGMRQVYAQLPQKQSQFQSLSIVSCWSNHKTSVTAFTYCQHNIAQLLTWPLSILRV